MAGSIRIHQIAVIKGAFDDVKIFGLDSAGVVYEYDWYKRRWVSLSMEIADE